MGQFFRSFMGALWLDFMGVGGAAQHAHSLKLAWMMCREVIATETRRKRVSEVKLYRKTPMNNPTHMAVQIKELSLERAGACESVGAR